MGSPREQELVGAVWADPTARTILERMHKLGLKEWWLTAGAVFQNVWNAAVACSVGVTKSGEGFLIYAPYGVDDLFNLHLRPNRALAPQHVYEAKVREYLQRWPRLTSETWNSQAR